MCRGAQAEPGFWVPTCCLAWLELTFSLTRRASMRCVEGSRKSAPALRSLQTWPPSRAFPYCCPCGMPALGSGAGINRPLVSLLVMVKPPRVALSWLVRRGLMPSCGNLSPALWGQSTTRMEEEHAGFISTLG